MINNVINGATPFKVYFEKVNGAEVIIEFNSRYVKILSSNKEVVSIIHFSKKINEEFMLNDLLGKKDNLRSVAYFVFEKWI